MKDSLGGLVRLTVLVLAATVLIWCAGYLLAVGAIAVWPQLGGR